MNKTKVKLCGFSTKETVDLAVKNGVNYVGFVFCERSKRNITPQKAQEISVDIPSKIKKVAVFVDLSDLELEQVVEHLKPDFLQIHDTDKNRISEIKKRFSLPIIKAFAVATADDIKNIDEYSDIAEYFLFDTKTDEAGGSGKSFDWTILKNLKTNKEWFLSGGLNINNIDLALNVTNAKMIDLSSGIEETKGIKSPKLITEFMNKIHSLNN